MRDFTDDLAAARKRVDEARVYLRIDTQRARLVELEEAAARPDLWDDQDAARKVTSELAGVRDDVELIDGLDGRIDDLDTLYELAREESDDSVVPEIDAGLVALRAEL